MNKKNTKKTRIIDSKKVGVHATVRYDLTRYKTEKKTERRRVFIHHFIKKKPTKYTSGSTCTNTTR